MRRLIVIVMFAAFAALQILSVGAAPPLIETFTNEGSFEFAGPCPNGVTLEGSFTETVRVTTYFNEAGDAVRVQIKVDYAGEVTNPETGQSVRDPGHQMVILDLVEDTETVVGLIYSVTVPGVGVVFHDVGRVVFDAAGAPSFEAGPHDVLNTEGDHAVRANFCRALTERE